MNVAELRARLKAMTVALAPLKTKALADGANVEDRAAMKAHLDAIKVVEEQLEMAEQDEALQAKHSQPANTPAGNPAPTVPAAPDKKTSADQILSLVAAGIIKAGKGGDIAKVLADDGYQGFVDTLKAAAARAGKSVNTLSSGDGGVLVPTTLDESIIPFLRNQATFLNSNPVRVQLVNGAFKQPRGATGATAGYVGEGGRKPVTQPTFDAIDMKAKKIAGIVPITQEARGWTIGNIEQYIRNDLRDAIATALDLNAYLGTGTGDTPLGILLRPGIQTVTPVFATATAPTIAELDVMANAFILKMTTANLTNSANWRWLMSWRTALYIASLRVGGTNGDIAYPEMQFDNSGGMRFKGIPVVVSNQFPTNGGTGTNETLIGLVDFSHVLFGITGGGITMKMTDQATIKTGVATDGSDLLHLWQQNMIAILAEDQHDFGLRRSQAVVKATAIKF